MACVVFPARHVCGRGGTACTCTSYYSPLRVVTCVCAPYTGLVGGIPLALGVGVSWILFARCSARHKWRSLSSVSSSHVEELRHIGGRVRSCWVAAYCLWLVAWRGVASLPMSPLVCRSLGVVLVVVARRLVVRRAAVVRVSGAVLRAVGARCKPTRRDVCGLVHGFVAVVCVL